ncbi:MAG: hypothetical protein LGR52_00065, partial [Candidatus Thiosymbion ectosymbiont of Robbea hypermnestra]|nr:hypothetical protein [Candidatus Thiosymbion ectosymbiont of Robbea hypermnestra]
EASGRRPWRLDSGVPPGMTVRGHRQRQEPAETTEAFFVALCEKKRCTSHRIHPLPDSLLLGRIF